MKNSNEPEKFFGQRIVSRKLKKNLSVSELVQNYFQAYNSARLNEACRLLTEKMLLKKDDVTIGITLAGALTPAGISGMVVSMMEKGFVDFIIATGANLYHDTHFALNFPLYKGSWQVDDTALWKHGIVRVYDIFLTTDTLLKTDKWTQKVLLEKGAPRGAISSREFHYYLGQKLLREAPNQEISLLAQATKFGVPVYTSSPGDSTYGMDLASFNKGVNPQFVREGAIDLHVNPNLDVFETAAIVAGAKQNGAILLGGGSPKNFYMQTQPFLWECLGIEKGGHDYFIQITMDSPQWGGLSGATPSEAVSWGKINPDELKNTVVVYADTTLAAPLLFAYAVDNARPRKRKQLCQKIDKLVYDLEKEIKDKPVTWTADALYEKHKQQKH